MSSTAASPATSTSTWNIDPVHSVAEFRVRHMMISNVRGQFTGVQGKLVYDPSNPASSGIEATIDVASINTHEPQRDAHLKSPDFLDADKFPTIRFQSSRVTRKAGGDVLVAGRLTIHGVTREVELAIEGPTPPVKDPWGNTRIAAAAKTTISRKDFGLEWNSTLETGGVLIGDEVHITLELEFVQAA